LNFVEFNFMTLDEFKQSVVAATMPPDLTPELRALWFTRAGQWEAAHDIAQDIPTPMGSWIHALLHLIEGDTGNANYWFARARRPTRRPAEQESLWEEIVVSLIGPVG
jgi:hypothetical protein